MSARSPSVAVARALLPMLLTSLGLAGGVPRPAHAGLDRYRVRAFDLRDFSSTTPKVVVAARDAGGRSTAVLEREGPTLHKLLIVSDATTTTFASSFNGFIWFSLRNARGPRGQFEASGGDFDASANAGTVHWPVLTGFAVTGATFCNAAPTFLCSLAVASHLTSVDPSLQSSFYDVGPWEFHGTGVRQLPFVFLTTTIPGNVQIFLRGALDPNATVPALPLLGTAVLGASLLTLAVAALRRHRGDPRPAGPTGMDGGAPGGVGSDP